MPQPWHPTPNRAVDGGGCWPENPFTAPDPMQERESCPSKHFDTFSELRGGLGWPRLNIEVQPTFMTKWFYRYQACRGPFSQFHIFEVSQPLLDPDILSRTK